MTNDSPPNGEDNEPPWVLIGLGSIVVVMLLFIIIACFQSVYVRDILEARTPEELNAWGVSGDFFGFPNAVFSSFAFALIIVTLWMQKHELSQQRKELITTHSVMKQQQFENTFFRMLELHIELVAAIRVKSDGQISEGRSSFFIVNREIERMVKDRGRTSVSIDLYNEWYHLNDDVLGHYFRTLYNIVRYVDDSDIDDKHTYSRLVRAQLSADEVKLLLYNGLGEHGKPKFKRLIEEYALLKHLRDPDIPTELLDQYRGSAFGGVKR